MTLTDRDLHDIGTTRTATRAEANKPFWETWSGCRLDQNCAPMLAAAARRKEWTMPVFLIVGIIAVIAYSLAREPQKREREEAPQVAQSSAAEIADPRIARKRMAVPWI
jgi:hypothetical protein